MPFYCKCLNIAIDAEYKDTLDITCHLSDKEKVHSFISKGLPVGRSCNIVKRQPLLVGLQIFGMWTLRKCLACSMNVYATHDEKNIMLINKDLQNLSTVELEVLSKSNDFSIFRILLPEPTVETHTSIPGRQESKLIMELQKFLNERIDEERNATDDRIKAFTDEQYRAFDIYKTKATRDFQKLTKIIVANSVFEDTDENKENIEDFVKTVTRDKDLEDENVPILANGKIETFSELLSGKKPVLRSSSSDLPFECMFAVDGLEDNVLEDDHFEEEDVSDTDDSGSHDEGIHIPRSNCKTVSMARSLPINVPMQMSMSEGKWLDHANQRYSVTRHELPVDIEASIKALANSVQGGDSTVFGDLPRPRLGSRI